MPADFTIHAGPARPTVSRSWLPRVQEAASILRRRFIYPVAGIVAALVIAVALFIYMPRMYRAESTLLVRYIADTTVLDPGASGGRVTSPDARGENIINSEVEILINRDSVEKIVDRVGSEQFVDGPPGPRQRIRAIEYVFAHLVVEAPRRSNIIKIAFDAPGAGVAQDALRALVDEYLKKHLAVHRSAAAYEFLVQQTDQARLRLQETEEELRKERTSAGMGISTEASAALTTHIAAIRSQLGAAEAQLAAATARMMAGRRLPREAADGGALETNAPSRGVRLTLQDRLALLEQRENELSRIYTEQSIPVQEIRGQMQQLLAAATNSMPTAETSGALAVDMIAFPERMDVAGLEAQVNALRTQLAAATQEAVRMDEFRLRIDQLDRTRQILDENYRMFSRSLEQSRINEALDAGKISNISVVQPPMIVAANFRPGLLRAMAIAFVVCAGGSIAAALLAEWRSPREPVAPGITVASALKAAVH